MATPRLSRIYTCPNCLGRLPLSRPAAPLPSQLQLSLTQVRYARTLTKAELEDLQGIPVRLLQDIIGFGRKNAIIRVKAGRMRNVWHHKGLAEYMTKKRFGELGLTESAIGVRDRTFGTQTLVEDDAKAARATAALKLAEEGSWVTKKESVTMAPEDSRLLLIDLLPEVLVFARKPITASASTPAPEPVQPEPVTPRSPSLAANAAISSQSAGSGSDVPTTAAMTPEQHPPVDTTAIFGSVSSTDILTRIREVLLVDQNSSRVALDADAITIVGLEGSEDRIKRLGRWEVDIVTGKGIEPVRRAVEVVAEE